MADITMCEGTSCPLANRCYRATATPNEFRQSYFIGVPIKGNECDEFWPNEAPIVRALADEGMG
jgi:hypothetical protein